jgi:UDP-N-acetyl-D-galactosamine dehydrogenase
LNHSPPVIAVLGLGYVGLPLVVEFGKHFRTIGFDIASEKVNSCKHGIDPSGEISPGAMSAAKHAIYSEDAAALEEADIILVAVPTPVDEAHRPDLTPLESACIVVGSKMKRGATVVFESTVYPGATEEVCIPILERVSGMRWMHDFSVGYSPERINPGDSEHLLTNVVKVVSGDTGETLERVAVLYERIVKPGVYRCSSIKVAEACKVIENTQRDLNIALMNELAIIFNEIEIDTSEVLAAASTKWNFLKYSPGLVGGHCIGVDPYYLTYKAETVGYHPQVILAGRRINDGMAKFIAEQTIKTAIAAGCSMNGARATVLGITFKENCSDMRDTKVAGVISELQSYGVEVIVHDPWADPEEAFEKFGVRLKDWDELPESDIIIAAVSHREFASLQAPEIRKKLKTVGCFIDVKANFDRAALTAEGIEVWRL